MQPNHTAQVIPICFDASGMNVYEIRERARQYRWPGCHIDIKRLMHGDGKTIVRRIRDGRGQ